MMLSRPLLILAALVAVVAPAGAQRWGGSPATAADKHTSSPQAHQAGGGSWNGTPSKWGGSPVQLAAESRTRLVYVIPASAYIPGAVAAPAPVPVTYVVDSVYTSYTTASASPVDMKVVSSGRAQSQETTMDVYRQQRFAKP
jgi:hypothetical protein